ncbi:hypothetical protein BGZ80_011458, partial [Entomortierella chlamydospora]
VESSTFDGVAGITESLKGSVGECEETELTALPVANLTEFGAKTTCAAALIRTSSAITVTTDSTASATVAPLGLSYTTEMANAPEPTSELNARVNAVKAAARILIAAEESQPQVNANGVVQATRYPPKKSQVSDGAVLDDQNDDIEPGVDMEHHMPVKGLKKRWEEIYSLGI